MDAKKVYEFWKDNVTPEEAVYLEGMSEDEIIDAFSAPLAFGTAGMRGILGPGLFRMNVYMVRRATAGLAAFINSEGEEAAKRGVVLSYDTRRMSKEFALCAAEVLSAAKIKVWIFENVRPVPMCSFAIRSLNAYAGVMITASHNPKEYNGYKVYGADGAQMSPEDTAIVVDFINKIDNPFDIAHDDLRDKKLEGGNATQLNDYVTVIGEMVDDAYFAAIEGLALSPECVAEYGKNLKLVYTPIHGTGAIPVMTILRRLGIKVSVVAEQEKPDTEFSTVSSPNPENKDTLTMGIKLADKIKADVVIGTDPDCDRMGVAVRGKDKQFIALTGNQIGVLLLDYIATRLTEKGEISAACAVVRSFVSTTLADKLAEKYGVAIFSVPTGFKFIGEKIKEWEQNGSYEYIFGFEESFGSLRGTHARDKDAVVATMLFSEMTCYYMSKNKTVYDRLCEIFAEFGWYVENNKTISYKGYDAMEKMAAGMDKLRNKQVELLGGDEVEFTTDYLSGIVYYPDGRMEMVNMSKNNTLMYTLKNGQFVCVRPSGTEPKLKLYTLAVANTEEEAKVKAEKLMDCAELLLN